MALPRLGDEVGVSVVQIDDENCYILGWWVGATRSPAQGGGGEDRRQPQHIAGLSLSRAANDPASWRTAGFETGTHRSYLNLICSFVITGL